MAKGFSGPGRFGDFVGLLEELKIVRPITGHNWSFTEACDMHFPPLPDWFVNALAIVILVFSLAQLRVFG